MIISYFVSFFLPSISEQLKEIRKMTLGRIMCMSANMHSVAVNPLYKAGAFLPRGVLLPNGVYITQ